MVADGLLICGLYSRPVQCLPSGGCRSGGCSRGSNNLIWERFIVFLFFILQNFPTFIFLFVLLRGRLLPSCVTVASTISHFHIFFTDGLYFLLTFSSAPLIPPISFRCSYLLPAASDLHFSKEFKFQVGESCIQSVTFGAGYLGLCLLPTSRLRPGPSPWCLQRRFWERVSGYSVFTVLGLAIEQEPGNIFPNICVLDENGSDIPISALSTTEDLSN